MTGSLALAACLTAWAALADTIRLDAEGAAARAVQVSSVAAAAVARSDAARAAVAATDAALYPAVLADAAVSQRSAVPEFAAKVNGPLQPEVLIYPNIETAYSASLQAYQILYAGGAVDAGRAASRHDLESSDAARQQIVTDLALAGRLGYWEAVRAEAGLEAAGAAEERAQRLLIDTQAQLEAGMAVKADVLAAQSRLASSHVAVVRAQTRRLDARAQLRSLLHLAAADQITLADRLTVALPPEPPPLAEMTTDALAHRPELAEVDAQLAGLVAREQLARAPARPTVAATAEWDIARPNLRYFPLVDAWNDTWSVGVAASWKLFDGGKARADARAAQANQRAVTEQRSELVRSISLEVETARQDLLAALGTVDAADAARAAAVERERASRERLAVGLAPMVETLDAQSDLATAEQQQIDSRAAAWISAARLQRATGR
jgi:outer membrane protein